jgi:ESS family glutamate:Na+ symporter
MVLVADPSLRPVASFALLGTLLTVGHVLRARIRLLRVLSLPASCVGGVVGLVLRQLVLRNVAAGHFLDDELLAGWSELPSLLTNVVFVTLVLGEPLPSPTQLWELSGPQLAFGQLLAFGQYAACALVVAVWLGPVYGVPRLFAAIVPLGYEGGHGVVAGNRAALERYDYPQGVSLGYVAATVGLLVGTLLGCALANWARWRGLLASHQQHDRRRQQAASAEANGAMDAAEGSMQQPQQPWEQEQEEAADNHSVDRSVEGSGSGSGAVEPPGESPSPAKAGDGGGLVSDPAAGPANHADFDGCYPEGSPARPRLGTCVVAVSSMDSLAHHLSLVGLVLSFAWCAKLGITALSGLGGRNPVVAALRATGQFLDPLPVFLYALLCAVCVQALMDRSPRCRALLPLDRDTAASICATAQDFLIASAVRIVLSTTTHICMGVSNAWRPIILPLHQSCFHTLITDVAWFGVVWCGVVYWQVATIEFDELAAAATPFFLCCLAAALWVFLCFLCCGRLLPDYWVERAVTEVGLSLGATATALLVVSQLDIMAAARPPQWFSTVYYFPSVV